MKKFLATLMMTAMMAVIIPLAASSANAQTTRYYRNGRVYTTATRKPSFYRRHRNLINMGIGTAAGAVIGGLIGGKRGALIGAGAGLGGSALYTYKLNPKKRRYYRVRRY